MIQNVNKRTILWYLTFTGNIISSIVITNINIGIVGMVNQTSIYGASSSAILGECLISNRSKMQQSRIIGTFSWNDTEQSILLGSFSWFLWLTLVPGGMLSVKYGSKIVFGSANFLASVLCFFIPVAAYEGLPFVIAIRVIQGMMDAMGNSCIHIIATKWIPENERSWFMATYVGGKSMAVVLAYPIFGWIIEVSSWENIFYVSGLMGIVWCLFWYFFMYDTPAQHKGILRDEREYIESTLGLTNHRSCPKTPWKDILLSPQVWLNLALCFTSYFALSFLLIYIPMYYTVIHGLSVESSAILSGTTHIFRLAFAIGFSFYFDHLLTHGILSRTNIRKITTSLCTIGTGIALLIAGYSGCNFISAAIFITIAIASTGFCNASFFATMVDIAPNFAGIIMAVASTFSTFAVFLLSSFVGYTIDEGGQSVENWKVIFIVTAGVSALPGMFFIAFGSAEVQPWNVGYDNVDDEECDERTSLVY